VFYRVLDGFREHESAAGTHTACSYELDEVSSVYL